MLFFILSGSAEAVPLIGTSYHDYFRIETYADANYVDSTHIKSFRHGFDWGILEQVMSDSSWGFAELADAIADFYPPMGACGEPIFVLGFWHPNKMLDPYQGDAPMFETWKVAPAYVDSFANFCYNLAYALKERMDLNWIVLHNEPNLYYGDSLNWENWRSSPEDFAWQCWIAAEAIKDANPSAYVVFGAFAGVTPDSFCFGGSGLHSAAGRPESSDHRCHRLAHVWRSNPRTSGGCCRGTRSILR